MSEQQNAAVRRRHWRGERRAVMVPASAGGCQSVAESCREPKLLAFRSGLSTAHVQPERRLQGRSVSGIPPQRWRVLHVNGNEPLEVE